MTRKALAETLAAVRDRLLLAIRSLERGDERDAAEEISGAIDELRDAAEELQP